MKFDDESKAIEDLMSQYFDSYERFEFDTCRQIWDFDHPTITLRPTELDEPLTNPAAISDYFDANFNIDLEIFRPTKIRIIDLISPTVAFVLADMVCRFVTKKSSEHFPAGHHVRWKGTSSFVFHKPHGTWRLIHYEDSTKWNLENVD